MGAVPILNQGGKAVYNRADFLAIVCLKPVMLGGFVDERGSCILGLSNTLSRLCYNELMSKRLILMLSLLAAVILLAMLNFTTPVDIGPFGVLVFFTTFYVLMLGIATILVRLVARILGKEPGRKEQLYAATIAFGPIMLMLAKSLGSMSILTVGATVVFVLLGCFLISKRL